MTRGTHLTTLVFAALILSACANVPSPNYVGNNSDESGVTVATLVGHIQCELLQAPNFQRLVDSNYRALITLTLKVEDNAGLSPSLSFIHPFSAPSTSLTYAVGGTLNVTRQRIFTNQYTIDLTKLKNNEAAAGCSTPMESMTLNLTGDLGIGGIIAGGMDTVQYVNVNVDQPAPDKPQQFALDATLGGHKHSSPLVGTVTQMKDGKKTDPARKDDKKPDPTPPSFGSTVQFTIVKSLNAGPNWVLKNFKGPNGSAGLLGAGRTDTDTLVIAFAPGPKKQGPGFAESALQQAQSEERAQSQIQNLTTNMILQNLTLAH